MRRKKLPLESGDFDENGELAETSIALSQGAPIGNYFLQKGWQIFWRFDIFVKLNILQAALFCHLISILHQPMANFL